MGPAVLDCVHFAAGECRSCTWLGSPYDAQLARKQAAVRQLLDPVTGPDVEWEPPLASEPAGFRTKAKLVVGGTTDAPTLGILGPDGGVDLRDCALYTPVIVAALPVLAELVTRADLTPYDVGSALPVAQRGELKHLLVTESPDGELMVRVVVRSTATEARIRKHLPWLHAALPALRVVTLNVQHEHRAVIEGEREIVLSGDDSLPMRLGDITLHLGPRSFFQTNTAAAVGLYAQARQWVADLAPARIVDLYCGVGGFALHLAGEGRRVTGIELSAEAVAAADRARDEAGLRGAVEFIAGDATSSDLAPVLAAADLVVVNPPRRGLGTDLARRLEALGAPHVLYSSCNPDTLARDLAELSSYRATRARLVDMFPQTPHAEVLVLAERIS